MEITAASLPCLQVLPRIGLTTRAPDFLALMKPRVMLLAVFTAFTGLMIAPVSLAPLLGSLAMMAIAAGAGGAGVLNMWYEADIDAVMTRTARRPIPRGRISRREALAFGLSLCCGAVLVLGMTTNVAAAGLLAFTIFFYVVVYTLWLKRITPQNIVIGGVAGSLPPVVGWASATGNVGLEPVVLFLIIFLWTPPHFWALSLNRANEYKRARQHQQHTRARLRPAYRIRGGRRHDLDRGRPERQHADAVVRSDEYADAAIANMARLTQG
jgi:protoheme IX farnesyltransferase